MEKIKKLALETFGEWEQILAVTLSKYKHKRPKNLFVPMAEIYVQGKLVWRGDLDVTISLQKLKDFSKHIDKPIVVYGAQEKEYNVEPLLLIKDITVILREEESKFYRLDDKGIQRTEEKLIDLPLHDDFEGIYTEDKYPHSFEVPDFKLYDHGDKKCNPYEFFYGKILETIGENDSTINPSKVIVNKRIYDLLLFHYETWLMEAKELGFKDHHKDQALKIAKQGAAPLLFQASQLGPKWSDENKVYAKTGFYQKKIDVDKEKK